ncbi:MAG: hypothetical protein R3F11_15150 [Verrucomicrobiales bacterium]
MGAYYTKEDITEYISKNTILPFLPPESRPLRCLAELWDLLKKPTLTAISTNPSGAARARPRKRGAPPPGAVAIGLDPEGPTPSRAAQGLNAPAPTPTACPPRFGGRPSPATSGAMTRAAACAPGRSARLPTSSP